jgi:hypothetical protein
MNTILFIIINIIGFYYVFKCIISYIKYGFSVTDIDILKERCYQVILFTLCFFVVAVGNFIISGDELQIIYAVLHGIVLVLNSYIYQKYN